MRESIGYRGNCRGRLYFAKPLIVDKEERAITLQRTSDSSAELIADEWRDRAVAQIEVVLSVERRIPMQFPQRSVKLVTARLRDHIDDRPAMPAVFGVERLGKNADLRQLIQAEKKPGSARGRIAEDRIGRIHTVDQNVRHIRAYTINCRLPALTARKQRGTTTRIRRDSRLQRNRAEKIAVAERQFGQALVGKQSSDSRRRTVDPGNVGADGRLLCDVAYRKLRIDPHFCSRSQLNALPRL